VRKCFLTASLVGFLTATEVLTTAGRMAATVDVPVVVDFDTGYGGAMNVFHTIEQAAKECVAGFSA
jgi:2-methylisocitrate lyase-like PEP mutase family enzyme